MTKKTRTKNSPKWGDATKLVRGGLDRTPYGETAEALYLNSGFVYDAPETAENRFANKDDGYVYGRYGNPTVTMFEERLALLEGAEACYGVASGMAAVYGALACQLKTGDHVVASKALFGSCYQIITSILPRFGIAHTMVDGGDMKAWSAAPQFPTLASALRCDENTLDAMARFAAALYAQTGNFTVMHMVTSAHALLTLRPWLGDVSLATRWFGVALLAAIRAARLTPAQIEAGLALLGDADAVAALPVQPWAELAAIVIDSDDDHAAKIVYSSRALFEMFGHPVLHAAATKGMLTQARSS